MGAGRTDVVGRNHPPLLAKLAASLPVTLASDDALDRKLATLGWRCDSRAVRSVAVVTATVGLVLAAPAVVLGRPLIAGLLAVLGAAAGYALLALPSWLVSLRRDRAAGATPDVIGLAVLRGRLDPTPEATATFAAAHASGPLADGLERGIRTARGRPAAGWRRFAATWGDVAPGLRRATSLVLAATAAEAERRPRLFDRAFDAVLDATRDRAASVAADLRGPTSALYAFGVVLPLALVAALPAIATAGVGGLLPAVIVVYDLVLPVVTLACAAWLLGRRPVAFPPVAVPSAHPDVPPRRRRLIHACAGGVCAAAVAGIGCRLLGPHWAVWVVVPGAGTGAALACWFRPVRAVRQEVVALESGLADALALVGGELQRGASPEAAIAAAGETLDGPAGDVLSRADRVGRRLGVGVRESLIGDAGALVDVPSPRARGVATFLVHAGEAGERGGAVLVELADHVDALREVERDARTELSAIVGTLHSTAACFGPLVGGATVGMAASIGGPGAAHGTGAGARAVATVPAGPLGVAVGIYVLALAAILGGLATGLERGLDRALLGYQVGLSVLAASLVYPAAVLATRFLV